MSGTTPLRVATDGGCRPNPGIVGWAWVDEHGDYHMGRISYATNNIGELTAFNTMLEEHAEEDLELIYDSQDTVKSIREWGPDWKRRGEHAWRKKKNTDLIFHGIDLMDERERKGLTTIFTWKHSHAQARGQGDSLNEAADHLCTQAIKGKPGTWDRHGHMDV